MSRSTENVHYLRMSRRIGTPFGAVLWAFVMLQPGLAAGENWTSFQNGGRSLPADLPSGDEAQGDEANELWSADIPGTGQSSPVVWNEHVYVTSVTGPQKEMYHLCAFNLADGVRIWQHDLSNASPQESTNYVSLAAPTPIVDEHGVVAFFEGGNLIALDHNGNVRWERNLTEEYGPFDSRHGVGASLAQSDQLAFVWVERSTEPFVLAVNKMTGETQWKVAGAGATSWSSPRLLPVAGGEHLVLSAVGSLTGLDPQTGARLWTLTGITGNSTPTPMPFAEGRLLIGATVGRGGGDTGSAAESNGVVAVEQAADGTWNAHYVWGAKRATSSFGSPIIHDRMAYFVNRAGVLYGLDSDSGEERFAERLGGSIWATPVARQNRIYFPRKDGTVTVIASGPEFRKVTEYPVLKPDDSSETADASAAPTEGEARGPGSGPTLYAAVLVGNRLLVRFGDRLTCLSLQ